MLVYNPREGTPWTEIVKSVSADSAFRALVTDQVVCALPRETEHFLRKDAPCPLSVTCAESGEMTLRGAIAKP